VVLLKAIWQYLECWLFFRNEFWLTENVQKQPLFLLRTIQSIPLQKDLFDVIKHYSLKIYLIISKIIFYLPKLDYYQPKILYLFFEAWLQIFLDDVVQFQK
jgi:hypothetical protein